MQKNTTRGNLRRHNILGQAAFSLIPVANHHDLGHGSSDFIEIISGQFDVSRSDRIAIKILLNGDMGHSGGGCGPMPVFFTRRELHRVPRTKRKCSRMSCRCKPTPRASVFAYPALGQLEGGAPAWARQQRHSDTTHPHLTAITPLTRAAWLVQS
jgi:hypothetical protein